MEDIDYKAMEASAPEQLKSGKPLSDKGGAFASLLEKILDCRTGRRNGRPYGCGGTFFG